jgi:hypothetical protein
MGLGNLLTISGYIVMLIREEWLASLFFYYCGKLGKNCGKTFIFIF